MNQVRASIVFILIFTNDTLSYEQMSITLEVGAKQNLAVTWQSLSLKDWNPDSLSYEFIRMWHG